MTPEVQAAIEEIRQSFPGHLVDAQPEPQGGAYVIVHSLDLGERYTPTQGWIGFVVSFQYPRADVYPHFLDGGVRRVDGQPHGLGMYGPIAWRERSALQLSRRSRQWNPAVDTAAAKLHKVLEWVRSR